MNRFIYLTVGSVAGLAVGGAGAIASPLIHAGPKTVTPPACLRALNDEGRAVSDAASAASAYSRIIIPAYKAGASASPIKPVTTRMQLGTGYMNEATGMIDQAIPEVAKCLIHRTGGV